MFVADFGQVEVNESRFERAVAEVSGELAQAGSGFEHVGGVAVAEGVDAHFFVLFHEAAFVFGHFDGGPDGGWGHGLAAVVEGLF